MESGEGGGGAEVQVVGPRSRWLTIEPVLFLVCFSSSFTEAVMLNVIEWRICSVSLGLNSSVCGGELSPEVKAQVQPLATRLVLVKSVLEAAFPAVLSFFIGPWSDSNGRKPFLLYAVTGYMLHLVVWACIAFWNNISPLAFLLASLIFALPGGFTSIFTCSFCYIGDITSEKNRGVRMVTAESLVMLGVLCGFLLAPKVMKSMPAHYSGPLVFMIASIACLLAIFYLVFSLPESVDINQAERKKKIFELGHVKEMFNTVIVERPNKGRTIIILLLFACSISITTMLGEISVRYLSVQQKFSWTQDDYNKYCALLSFIGAFGSLGGMWVATRVLSLSDLSVALWSGAVALASSLLMAFSASSLWFVLASALGCLSALNGPVLRSELSKMVPKTDLGKLFAIVTSAEAVVPLFGSPLYTLLYGAVLLTSPMSVYFLSVGFTFIRITLIATVIVMERSFGKPYYTVLVEDEEEENTSVVSESSTCPINT